MKTEFDPTFLDMNLIKSTDPEILKAAGVEVEKVEEEFEKSMRAKGLVQKEITVRGKNGSYYQKKVWAHPNESPVSGKKIDPKKASTEQSKKSKDALEKVRARKKAEADKNK